ncbi:MAG: hypothetical protein AAGF83_15260 [Cyanobacteria bacterium P01_G01_bin.67]
MIKVKYLLISIVITFYLQSVSPSHAKNIHRDRLEEPLNLVRKQLITKGISAYQAGYYPEAIHLLRDFLSRRRIITTPLEKEGLIYLALAYQQEGESSHATETITRAIFIANNSPIELARLENTAGIIAQQQAQTAVAIAHWEKARQLYLASNQWHKWSEITLKLAHNYHELGNNRKYQELLAELELEPITYN